MSVYFLSVIKMCHPGMALNGPEKRHGEKKKTDHGRRSQSGFSFFGIGSGMKPSFVSQECIGSVMIWTCLDVQSSEALGAII